MLKLFRLIRGGHSSPRSVFFIALMENDPIQIFHPNFPENSFASKLLLDTEFSDVTLVCADNKQVTCHRAVLASSSSFLRELLLTSKQQNTFLYLGRVQEVGSPYPDSKASSSYSSP